MHGERAVVSGSIAHPDTVMVPGARVAESNEPNGLPAAWSCVPSARAARFERVQQYRLRSTPPVMPGTDPTSVYCHIVQVPQPPGRAPGVAAEVQLAIQSR